MKTDAGNWLEVVCIFTLIFVKQSTEVPDSNAMELESLKRQLLYLDQENVNVENLRLTGIPKCQATWLRKNQQSNTITMFGI